MKTAIHPTPSAIPSETRQLQIGNLGTPTHSRLTLLVSMAPVKFYDILSIHPKTWWSANTYKTRFVLNYKQIPYTTIGVHYPDIQEISKKLGLGPAEHGIAWTLPVVEYYGTVVRGSFDIAKFLDFMFPERRIVGEECDKWVAYMGKSLVRAIWPLATDRTDGTGHSR